MSLDGLTLKAFTAPSKEGAQSRNKGQIGVRFES